MNRVVYREWFPQIVYNHHQTGSVGHRHVRAALPGSAEPQPRPDHHHQPGPGRVGHAPPLRRRGQGRHHDAAGRQLLDLVERRPAHHALLQEHDRPAHRDHRPPHPDRNPLPPEPPDHPRRPAAPGHPRRLALPAVGRLLADRQPGRARLRGAQPRAPALQHLAHGHELDRAGRARLVDDPAEVDRRGGRRGGCARLHSGIRGVSARPGEPRRPRLHPAGRPARLPQRDALRERASEGRRQGAPGGGRLQRGREGLPRRLVRGDRGAGVPAARARHVRAAEPPERLPVSGRAADRALRQRRVDARAPDGRRVRPHSRRVQRALRGDRVAGRADGGDGGGRRVAGGLRGGPCERGVHRGEPGVGGRGRGFLG